LSFAIFLLDLRISEYLFRTKISSRLKRSKTCQWSTRLRISNYSDWAKS